MYKRFAGTGPSIFKDPQRIPALRAFPRFAYSRASRIPVLCAAQNGARALQFCVTCAAGAPLPACAKCRWAVGLTSSVPTSVSSSPDAQRAGEKRRLFQIAAGAFRSRARHPDQRRSERTPALAVPCRGERLFFRPQDAAFSGKAKKNGAASLSPVSLFHTKEGLIAPLFPLRQRCYFFRSPVASPVR